MQDKETLNLEQFTDPSTVPGKGRMVAIDVGTRWIGIAVCDELQLIATPVRTIERQSWKRTLKTITDILTEFDAIGIVIGLPLNTDGSESEMSVLVRRFARNISLSIGLPVILQDERATTYEARGRLWKRGVSEKDTKRFVDSEAAAIILSDFLDRRGRAIRPLDHAG